VYAATAFVILELASNVADPLNLPDWTLPLVIILLSIGFVVSLVVSWIYEPTPEGLWERTEPQQSGEMDNIPPASSSWKVASYISFVVIIVLIIFNIIPRIQQSDDLTSLEKSIAVLPFNNLSSDSTQLYFCEAMREEILNHLDKVELLSVRSRTSTDQYRNTKKNITEIGNELNVNYLVEGSVGIESDKMKIWIQLINAQTDEHVWSDNFVRERRQIFAVQNEIAQTIAAELKTTLTPEEIEEINETPTENIDAYQAYMRGRYYANQPHHVVANSELALESFQKAVDIDSTFALAYGALAMSHALYRYLSWDLSDSRLERATQAAEKALELGADQPEVQLALGYYSLWGYRDQKKMSEHWEIASKGLPNNVDIIKAKAEGLESEGKWKESLKLFQKANTLDPNVAGTLNQMGFSLWWQRQFSEAVDAYNEAITLAPNEQFPYILKTYTIWSWEGPNERSREALEIVSSSNGWYRYMWFWQEVGEGDYDKALQLMSDTVDRWGIHSKAWSMPKSLLSAFVYKHLGKDEQAQHYFKVAAEFLEKKVKEVPSHHGYHSSLGIAYAGLGFKEKAVQEVTAAQDLLPVSKDAVYACNAAFDMAIVYTMIGEFELAVNQLEYLLSFPNFASIGLINWDIRFAPLKDHPRYKELLDK